ncbi:uncharacterized protein LOC126897169 [Daktulosphaira vitifoliae]|uniref:uncharacterized protein LOC126897169 n=1 Tax=Daktulosphaira vitifoliae TaxID=58002 RepID=UPI0021AA8BC4|nr:uncharacterized protein LOC126897169 [Daktulosphaira vitifoliae]
MVRDAMATDDGEGPMRPISPAEQDIVQDGATTGRPEMSSPSQLDDRPKLRVTFAQDGDLSNRSSCNNGVGVNGGADGDNDAGGDDRTWDERIFSPNGKPNERKRDRRRADGDLKSPIGSTSASSESEQSDCDDKTRKDPMAMQTAAMPLNLMVTGEKAMAEEENPLSLSEDEGDDVEDDQYADEDEDHGGGGGGIGDVVHERSQPAAASWTPPWWIQSRTDDYSDKPTQTAELLLVGGRLPPGPGAAQPARVFVPTADGGVAVAQAVLLVLEPPVPTVGTADQHRLQHRQRYRHHHRSQTLDDGVIPGQHQTSTRDNNGHRTDIFNRRATPPPALQVSSAGTADRTEDDTSAFVKQTAAAICGTDDPAAYVRQQQRQITSCNAAAYYYQRQQQRLEGGVDDDSADNPTTATTAAAIAASTTMAALMAASAVPKRPTWSTPESSRYYGGSNGRLHHQQYQQTANGSAMMHPAAAAAAAKKRKRRTSFTPHALELLNGHFDRNTHPSGAEITALAARLGYDREVVRIWFCNKRQALKNAAATAVGIRSVSGLSGLNGNSSLNAAKYYAAAATAAP